MPTLTPSQHALLQVVHRADEEDGGLSTEDIEDDEYEDLEALVVGGFVETQSEGDGDAWVRVTARGLEALRGLRGAAPAS